MHRLALSSLALAALLGACGGSDAGNLFSGGAGTGGLGGVSGAAAGSAGGSPGVPQGGASGAPDPAAGGSAPSGGAGGEHGGAAGSSTNAGGADAGTRTGGSGGSPVALPTGTQGFPTNDAACPSTLPGSKVSCSFGLPCQYLGMLCVCGPSSAFGCTTQANQCLEQAHCSSGYCHPNLHVCTECVSASQCTAPTPQCRWDGMCVQCLGDPDCAPPTPVCNIIPLSPTLSSCVQCRQDSDCAKSQKCSTFLGTCQ